MCARNSETVIGSVPVSASMPGKNRNFLRSAEVEHDAERRRVGAHGFLADDAVDFVGRSRIPAGCSIRFVAAGMLWLERISAHEMRRAFGAALMPASIDAVACEASAACVKLRT